MLTAGHKLYLVEGSTLGAKNVLLYMDVSYKNMLTDSFQEVAAAMQTELNEVNAKLEAIEELLK